MHSVINPERIEELREFDPGNSDELIRQLFAVYFTSIAEKLEALKTGQNENETSRLIAHAIKSASLNLGCDKLAALCRSIELDPSLASSKLEECVVEFNLIKNEFIKFQK